METKFCARCGEDRPISEFNRHCRTKSGYQVYCRPHQEQVRRESLARKAGRAAAYGKAAREKLRAEMFDAYGHECACCGEDTPEFLQIDHIDGVVPADQRVNDRYRRRITGEKLYRRLRTQGWPEGYRVLCANCNFAHGQYGYCPHKRTMEVIRGAA